MRPAVTPRRRCGTAEGRISLGTSGDLVRGSAASEEPLGEIEPFLDLRQPASKLVHLRRHPLAHLLELAMCLARIGSTGDPTCQRRADRTEEETDRGGSDRKEHREFASRAHRLLCWIGDPRLANVMGISGGD